MRTLVIGDVHGCIDELRDLLTELKYRPGSDRLYFIGDLINKGPSSIDVFQYVQSLNAVSILGNHELALLHQVQHDWPERKSHQLLREEFGRDFDKLVRSIQQWPRLIRLPGILLVHAGVPPGQLPEAVHLHTLVNIRTWDGKGQHLFRKTDPPWFDLYRGRDHVVFGHWAALRGIQTPRFTGLDSGCVYGGTLSGLILPEHKVVQIPARQVYDKIKIHPGHGRHG